MSLELDELNCIQKIISGDTQAYTDIVRAYQGKVLGLCLSFLANSTEAEDAAQEVFIKAYQSLKNFRGNSSFSTWLYRITANHCKDLLRKRSRQKTESLEALMEQAGDGAAARIEPSTPDPSHAAEAAGQVERLLASLTADERLILTLREAEGLSYQEIAAVLECTLDAVKARLKRARQSVEEKRRHFSASGSV